jgi:hypothetical protein
MGGIIMRATALFFAALATCFGCGTSSEPSPPSSVTPFDVSLQIFYEPDQVARIDAVLSFIKNDEKFEVPKEHVPAVLEAMRPVGPITGKGSTCKVIARMNIETDDGRLLGVLVHSHGGPNQFAAHRIGDGEGIAYYAGDDAAKLRRVLLAAYEARDASSAAANPGEKKAEN